MQGVRRPVESWELINQGVNWKTVVAEKCTESRESNTWKYLKVASRSPHRSLLEDSILQEKIRRVSAFEIIKGEMKRSHFAGIKSRRRNLGLFRRSYQGATSGQNSLWRIPETVRTVGSWEVAGWLKVSKLSTLGSRINVDRWSWFSLAVRSFQHFGDPNTKELSTVKWKSRSRELRQELD